MINKLTLVEYLLEDAHLRGKFVYINTATTPSNLPRVYSQAARLRLYDDSDYDNIVKKLTDNVNSSINDESSNSQSSATESSPTDSSWQRLPNVSNDQDVYDLYDDVGVMTFYKKENEVHYLASRLHLSKLGTRQYSGSKDLEDIDMTELYTAENRSTTMLWLQTTVLPKVASDQDLASIVKLLKVPIDEVRATAREVLWTILFSKGLGEIPEKRLKDIESTLFDQASKVNQERDNCCEWSELICMYTVTVIHRIYHLVEQNRSLESAFKRKLIMLQADDEKLADITAFMENFKTCPKLFIKTLKSGDLKEFGKKDGWHGQFLVVLKSLLEMFQGGTRLTALKDLQKLTEPKKHGIIKPLRSLSRLHWLVGTLSTVGITSYLKTFEERTGEDLHDESIAAFRVLKANSEFLMGSTHLMSGLMFSSNDLVRKETVTQIAKQSYLEDFRRIALSEVSGELKPINIDLTERLRETQEENSWMKVPVGRVSQRVMLHIHIPQDDDHARQLKSSLTPSKCGHRNTIEILRSFAEHPHILSLFAFRVDHIPVFYVTEDYSQPNLHKVLYCKAKGKVFLQPVELLELLNQALDAVVHLHKNKIVHRDITASSFIFNQKHNHVKLFKLDLARVNLHTIIVDRESSGIPVRWSAPESLSKGYFTFSSDYWMIGHLIYEVSTHGTLPYSDLEGKTEEEIAYLIKSGTKKLHQERCIPTKVFDAIMRCTKLDEQDRIPVCEVKCKIEDTLDDYKRPGLENRRKLTEKDFPALKRMEYDGPSRNVASEYGDKDIYSVYTRSDGVSMRSSDLHSHARYLIYNIPTIENVTKHGTKLEIIETQKRQFTQAEESSLLTQNLDGFSDHVKIVDFEDREALSYSIPVNCEGSFHLLIEDVHRDDYLRMLWACAKALTNLHSRNWIHGALSSKNIWINNKQKVYLTELAYMRQSCMDESGIVSDDSEPPKEEEVLRRSAPEVIHGGTYSPACDVFSFGLVVWEVYAGGNVSPTENILKRLPIKQLYEYLTTQPGNQLLRCPRNCPPEIYSLVKMCWCPERHERPLMGMVFNKLNDFITSRSMTCENHFLYMEVIDNDGGSTCSEYAEYTDGYALPTEDVGSGWNPDQVSPSFVEDEGYFALPTPSHGFRTDRQRSAEDDHYQMLPPFKDDAVDDRDYEAKGHQRREEMGFRFTAQIHNIGTRSASIHPPEMGRQRGTESIVSTETDEDAFGFEDRCDVPPPLPPLHPPRLNTRREHARNTSTGTYPVCRM